MARAVQGVQGPGEAGHVGAELAVDEGQQLPHALLGEAQLLGEATGCPWTASSAVRRSCAVSVSAGGQRNASGRRPAADSSCPARAASAS
ncbi:hypothetical protein ACIRQQ_20215 [Streptomyces fuscichromogenes]|uniref:hypothetical protein n=1 Tax=Streptomyces fuscichromogenes TaxID=1324013 RepID=UPI0038212D25